MRKILFICLVSNLFFACNNSDNNINDNSNSQLIIGLWNAETLNSSLVTDPSTPLQYEFSKNHVFKLIKTYENTVEVGTWSLNLEETKLTMITDNIVVYDIILMSNEKLIFSVPFIGPDTFMEYVLRKVD